MELYLYNTMSRQKEVFKPIVPEKVGFYSCGPTVYWYQHIGNLRTYIFNDLLKRVLAYNGYSIDHVMNITDVGHLTSDQDEGDDKMELAAQKENKTAAQIAQHYTEVFFQDCEKLNIIKPKTVCKATEYIQEQIDTIKTLEQKGVTYKTDDGIYFDTSKIEDYGKLDPGHKHSLEEGKRVSKGDKKNPTDFALWKFSETPGQRQQEWESPWGLGFPGWHIECSAMSTKYLGDQFDIHTGGEDHVQIHHTNEIAQSEAAYGKKPWVGYWMHGAFLTTKGEKISKSKGGLYTISQLQEQGFDPLAFRYLCLGTTYRKQLNFSLDILKQAQQTYNKLKNAIVELKKESTNQASVDEKYQAEFQQAVNDDLNIPKALGILWDVLKDKTLSADQKLALACDFDKVLGLNIEHMQEEKIEINQDIQELINQREQARTNKDWALSDQIRDQLKEQGIELIDTPEGTQWKKVK